MCAIDAATKPRWLQEIPAVPTLRQVWAEQYVNVEGALTWREVKAMPSPAELIASPHDPEARYRVATINGTRTYAKVEASQQTRHRKEFP
jgi:hypothetical protein